MVETQKIHEKFKLGVLWNFFFPVMEFVPLRIFP